MWNAYDDMTNYQRNFSVGEVEIEKTAGGNTIYHKTEYRERRDHFAFYHVNAPVAGFDTDRETFMGLWNGMDEPQVVAKGESGNSVASGWAPVAPTVWRLRWRRGRRRPSSSPWATWRTREPRSGRSRASSTRRARTR